MCKPNFDAPIYPQVTEEAIAGEIRLTVTRIAIEVVEVTVAGRGAVAWCRAAVMSRGIGSGGRMGRSGEALLRIAVARAAQAAGVEVE